MNDNTSDEESTSGKPRKRTRKRACLLFSSPSCSSDLIITHQVQIREKVVAIALFLLIGEEMMILKKSQKMTMARVA